MISMAIDDGVAKLTMCRPPVNALDAELVRRLSDALDAAEAAGVTVLTISSDQKCFCAGADLAMVKTMFASADPQAEMASYVVDLHRLFDRLERFPAVTVAAIGGPAMGGGLELALCCDLRVVSSTAKLGLPEAAVGLFPAAGGTQRLTRLCGHGTAARVILGAEILDGAEAFRLGIAEYRNEPEALAETTHAIAARIGKLSRPALRAAKQCIADALDPARDGFAAERARIAALMGEPETEAFVSAFFQRRK